MSVSASDGMLHFGQQCRLKADEIARQEEIEDLPAAILEKLVAEPPARQDGVDMGALAAFRQKVVPGSTASSPILKPDDEFQFLPAERAE